MASSEDRNKHSKRRQRNFLAKKLREGFRKKIHIDAKQKEKERRWKYEEETSNDNS